MWLLVVQPQFQFRRIQHLFACSLFFSISIIFLMIQQGIALSFAADFTCGGFNVHLHVLRFIDFNQFPNDSAGGCRAQWRLHPTKLSTCAGSRVWSTLCTCFFHLRIWPAAKPRTATDSFVRYYMVAAIWTMTLLRSLTSWTILGINFFCFMTGLLFPGFSSQLIALTILF